MTDDAKTESRIPEFLKDEAKKWVARAFFAGLSLTIVAALTPLGYKLRSVWHTPEQLQEVKTKLDGIAASLDKLTGAGRVTMQPDGMSYVREPVTVGQPIVLVLFIGRTDVGTGCILRESIPLFVDENDVQRSGERRKPTRQLGPEVVRREVELDQPGGLVPGRTRLQLQLEYTCGDETIFELTKPVFYYALPA